jgi:2-deoxy-D-gluconate 3-dehydrogenase
MFRLEGKRALVTGAAKGIGQAIAAAFAEQGAKVAVSDLPGESLESTEKMIRRFSENVLPLSLDVRDAGQRENGIRRVCDAFGGIDILVNNAGINRPSPGLEATEENWDNTFNTNVKGSFFLTQLAAPYMIKAGWGRVIFVASQSGLIAIPGQPIYCSSKGAVLQAARTLGVEWAKFGVTVNAIAPTFIKTALTEKRLENPEFFGFVLGKIPCGKLAEVNDVAYTAVFLASEEAKMINCHTLCVDGGWTVW